MSKIFNWGIVGPGKIAHKFAADLALLPNARLHSVVSRSRERAQAFAAEFGLPHYHDDYDAFLDTPGLDAVYIATPHSRHREDTLRCLKAGLAVLCEKPLAINAREVEEMVATARRNDVFLMEALWTRFLPTTRKALELIDSGTIGEVLSVKADFGFKAPFDPQGRLFNPELGGGSLLDIGIYPVFLALLVLGRPAVLRALARIGETGVDEECGVLMQYPGGQMAHLHSTILAPTKTEAFIYGERGVIHLHTRWHEPTTMSLLLEGERPQDLRFDFRGKGYSYEAEEVMRCLEQGLKESPLLSLDFSVDLMHLLDAIRREAGIIYPAFD